jgi:hypothetical protein
MHKGAIKRSMTGLVILVGSCCPGLAYVGQTTHDWSVVVPKIEARLGIVEWLNGRSTVFLGFFDFSLPCAAVVSALAAFTLSLTLVGALLIARGKLRQIHAA